MKAVSPDVVVEIRSPEDETTEKLPFHAEIGVREIRVIDRDTRAVEIQEVAAAGGGGPRRARRRRAAGGEARSPASRCDRRPRGSSPSASPGTTRRARSFRPG